ncbi:MAG TPA: cupin domain-containing protein [Jatrophihabitans sp.]|nr:cupin domain-containing protein [Jatrophihabitans sp.]
MAAVDELLSRRALRTPFIRMAKQGKVIPPSAFTRSGGLGAGIADQVADDKVLGLVADGATLVLQALHRSWPPLVQFGSALAAELGHPVQINSYLTPAQNQGFAPHYDTHDVFVLQAVGSKRWVIHEPVRQSPLPGQDWEKYRDEVAARAAGAPLIDTVLRPGDALYLPRGFIHSAVAQGETSLHLTVGVHPVTRYALLRQLLAEAAEEPELRTSLPVGLDLATESALSGPLAETVASLTGFLQQHRLPAVLARLADQLADQTRPAPIEPMAQLDVLAGLAVDTPVRIRPGLRPRVEQDNTAGVAEQAAGLVLRALDARISLSAQAEPALKQLQTGAVLPAGRLPGLSEQDSLELSRRLLTAAVLVPGA